MPRQRLNLVPLPEVAPDVAALSLRSLADHRCSVRFACQACGEVIEYRWLDLRMMSDGHSTMTLGDLQAVLVCDVCGERGSVGRSR